MSEAVQEPKGRVYRGLWGVLTRYFHVPEHPPTLPVRRNETIESFRPARGFLSYLRFQFFLGLAFLVITTILSFFGITLAFPFAGFLTGPLVLALEGVTAVVGFLAIRLRYDTTWYVMTDRSLRIRRGIWVIHETTITFENVQNVSVSQGPLQRYFGIANVLVETAGGGGGGESASGNSGQGHAHRGLIEGVTDATALRDKLLARLRVSRTAGLGDEGDGASRTAAPAAGWTPDHLELLQEIRAAARKLAGHPLQEGGAA